MTAKCFCWLHIHVLSSNRFLKGICWSKMRRWIVISCWNLVVVSLSGAQGETASPFPSPASGACNHDQIQTTPQIKITNEFTFNLKIMIYFIKPLLVQHRVVKLVLKVTCCPCLIAAFGWPTKYLIHKNNNISLLKQQEKLTVCF